ncbi:MAG: hypothetical protein JWQ38_1093 [Flavipsychrobacter sp.]|nr:hypothetical protein [Flavipsychrobacter sp.]
MKTIASWLFIVLGIGVLISGTSRNVMAYVSKAKQHSAGWWGEHQCNCGDLTNMSYLDDIDVFHTPKDYQFKKPIDNVRNKQTDLYLYGDSYVEDVPSFVFAGIHAFHAGRAQYTDLLYTLDRTKKNVLIIERSERYIRSEYRNLELFNHLKQKDTADPKQVLAAGNTENGGVLAGMFNKNLNQNLEYLLFNMNIVNRPRNMKADMNYYLFNRGSGNAVIADAGNHLFLKETVDATGGHSSYSFVNDEIVDGYARNLHDIYTHYRLEGFDEVYFSFIPNPASLIQPANYNRMLPKLQSRMPEHVIDMYTTFKNHGNPKQFYRAGDTHWNDRGMQLWLTMVNEKLKDKGL